MGGKGGFKGKKKENHKEKGNRSTRENKERGRQRLAKRRGSSSRVNGAAGHVGGRKRGIKRKENTRKRGIEMEKRGGKEGKSRVWSGKRGG